MIGGLIYLLQERCNPDFDRFKIEALKEGVTFSEMPERLQEQHRERHAMIIGKTPLLCCRIPVDTALAKPSLQFRIKRTAPSLNGTQRRRGDVNEYGQSADAE